MRSIVVYTDAKRPRKQYPHRILSPTHPRACCADHMKVVGTQHRDRGKFVYMRCEKCGYTVRRFIGLDWRWIRTQLTPQSRPVARHRSEPWTETWIAGRWVSS